ncbi:hypothetical protein ES703_11029 [subsurface metagenome]
MNKNNNECNRKYKECKYYIPKIHVSSRCGKNGVASSCKIEQEYLKRFSNQVNEYIKNNLK